MSELNLRDDLFVLRMSGDINDAPDWLKAKGFRAVVVAAPGSHHMGVVFDHGVGTPVQMAMVDDVLAYDPETDAITVR